MSAFFGEQALRLMRERWASADELAEELYSMATKRGPTATDNPLVLYRTGDDPAIKIIDRTDGATPPIQIVGGNPNTEAVGPGDFKCCGNGGTTTPSGGGGSHEPPEDGQDDGSGSPTPVDGSGQPGSGTPGRIFTGTLEIEIHSSGDPYGWDGQRPFFTSSQCKVADPPPSSAMDFSGISNQLIAFLGLPTLAPYLTGYTVITDEVSEPGAPCVT